MAFKLVHQEQRQHSLSNEDLITFLLENHNNILSTRGSPSQQFNETSDDISIPDEGKEIKKEFDFFQDDAIDAAREAVLSDLEVSTIKKQTQINEVIVDRRRSRTK